MSNRRLCCCSYCYWEPLCPAWNFHYIPGAEGLWGRLGAALGPFPISFIFYPAGQAVKMKVSNTFQRKSFVPNSPLAHVDLRCRMSWRPRLWQLLKRDFQDRGTNRNIQCLRKTHFVLLVFDGTLLRDNRPPELARGGQIQLRRLVLPAPERGSQGRQEGCPARTGDARGFPCWINNVSVAHWNGLGPPNIHMCIVPGATHVPWGCSGGFCLGKRAGGCYSGWGKPLGSSPSQG